MYKVYRTTRIGLATRRLAIRFYELGFEKPQFKGIFVKIARSLSALADRIELVSVE